MIDYRNMDCMDLLKSLSDQSIDLAIVDPPYFKGPHDRGYYGSKASRLGVVRFYGKIDQWDVPGQEYFDELFRVSKHQIIWGCNYYDYNFGSGRIIWDKVNGDSSFSDCEISFCSLHDSTRLFRYMWAGFMQGKSIKEGHVMQGNKKLNETRIHPTQKPVALYKWLLIKYAQKGWKILDTHGGSMSIGIACHDLGYDLLASELDKDMYDKSKERLDIHMSQLQFNFEEVDQ